MPSIFYNPRTQSLIFLATKTHLYFTGEKLLFPQPTYTHLLIFITVFCVSFLLRRYMNRKGMQKALANRRAQELARRQPPPMPPVQTAIGVPVEHLPNLYPPYTGTLRIDDPLRDNTAGYGWMDDSIERNTENEGCHFIRDSYALTVEQKPHPSMIYCLALRTNFSDFVYEIETTIIRGSEIGVVFRQTPGFRYYYFYICRDGTYGLERHNRGVAAILARGQSDVINIELHQSNILGIVANGSSIDLYINQQHLETAHDTVYSAGRIGTGTRTDAVNPSEVSFKNLRLWTLD